MSASSPLPIDAVLPQVRAALAGHGGAVLQAAPGAGKTTRVPLALLQEPWLKGQRILMLEPRRLATRAAARFMAATLGEKPGETVGFRVRLESQVSARTRIEVVTEGILTRRLQHDPALDGVGLVIFDEFHERSLDGDLGLALDSGVAGRAATGPEDTRDVRDPGWRRCRRAARRCSRRRQRGPRFPGGDALCAGRSPAAVRCPTWPR